MKIHKKKKISSFRPVSSQMPLIWQQQKTFPRRWREILGESWVTDRQVLSLTSLSTGLVCSIYSFLSPLKLRTGVVRLQQPAGVFYSEEGSRQSVRRTQRSRFWTGQAPPASCSGAARVTGLGFTAPHCCCSSSSWAGSRPGVSSSAWGSAGACGSSWAALGGGAGAAGGRGGTMIWCCRCRYAMTVPSSRAMTVMR